ncbi:DUF2797 domain-containing protein [Reinekea marina]|uniref:DUF2797 domain-containing protein n=1 Tax=Reinekea marina TaxID=1310421 RepID=A0ABV7WPB1_9GAMM|nr:DUF2797 domain-containing protein [Reinekea marina]MDN3649889.1 DUF2797 domain-containing protein [Reinekea marina]
MTMDMFASHQGSDAIASGLLRKMPVRWSESLPVQYTLLVGENKVPLNEKIGQKIRLEHTGEIRCLHCNEVTKKSFGQGYCYKHFMALAQNDACIMSPEKCHYDQGTCREPEWGERNCMQSHYVYLSNASGLKVGITRGGQIPTRWIDQGATQAMVIARVSTRLLAGLVEVIFKQHVADKTNWRTMLKGTAETLDLAQERDRLVELARPQLDELIAEHGIISVQLLGHGDPFNFEFPVQQYPEKVTSFNFDKDPNVEGTLLGIKGQYLILDTGVINIRRFGGYQVNLY